MKIDIEPIKTELQELAEPDKVRVKLNKKLEVASSIRLTDREVRVSLNPNKFRSPKKLEAHLNRCRMIITGQEWV